MNPLRWIRLLGLCALLTCAAAATPPGDLARMERDIALRVSNGQFMGSVLVARNGKVLLSKGYGSADLEWQIPNSPATKFRLGSITKQFTAASILLLEERGKLNIDDPLKKYLADEPAAWEPITIFNLLTHTSGIPNYTSLPGFADASIRPITPEQLLARFRDKPLDFVPGTSWNYSNSGYAVLGYLIEKLSGQTYAKFVQENLFTPLGMKNSGYDSNTEIIQRRAIGYTRGPNGLAIAPYVDMSTPFSAGGLYSTTGDLLRWEEGLFGGKVVSPASLARMTTAFKNDYAFGLGVRAAPNGDKIISHNGGINGFNTSLTYMPAEKLTIVVLANLNGPAADQIAADLTNVAHHDAVMLISDRVPIALPAADLDRLAGPYRFADGSLLRVSRSKDHLETEGAGPKRALYSETSSVFFSKEEDLLVAFDRDESGSASALVLTSRGQSSRAQRITEAQATEAANVLAEKMRRKVASAGTEAALRRSISEVAAGAPDYTQMTPEFATVVRQQLTQMQSIFKSWGDVKTVSFTGVAPMGADMYDVVFEKAAASFVIGLTPDGKIAMEGVQPKAQ
jgi:CubicO group peptidase (beta-lactamase class C family)